MKCILQVTSTFVIRLPISCYYINCVSLGYRTNALVGNWSVFSRLPVPWLLYGIIYGKPVEVNSVGMVCSIAILFFMLLFVIMSIACFNWKMNKSLGFTMFLLYFVFVAVSLLFEYGHLTCPV